LELAAKRGLHCRNGRDRRALGGARWRHLVEEAMDRGPALLVAQAREQLDETCGRVRHPVSVMAVVQSLYRAVHGQLHARGAAHAEGEQRSAALVDRTVADEPR